MSKSLAKRPPPSRYSYEAVTEEIERALSSDAARSKGITQKDVAFHCNLTEAQFSHRMRGVYSQFEVEHFGAIADFLKAPAGWPFVQWNEAARTGPPKKTR